MSWSYKREESNGFKPIPVGAHRIRIASVEKAQSKTGKDMLAFKFDVSGYNSTLFHYIVFLPDKPEITNRNLTSFYDSFKDIPEADFNINNWVGKVGACQVKHEEYNGDQTAKVHYFISADKQGNLPPWKEPEKKDGESTTTDDQGFLNVAGNNIDEIVPF